MDSQHVPVLLTRVVELIGVGVRAAREAGITPVVVDGTLGMGGHAEAVLTEYPDVHLIGIDRDRQAIDIASRRLERFSARTDIVHAVDDELPEILDDLGIEAISAILLDLGVSSLQLDEDERGFSYSRPAPLDMRMDQSQSLTAAEVLATYPESELRRILREYGEEKMAGRIAKIIVTDREHTPWQTSQQLAAMLSRVLPETKKRSHPAKRTFQALRIEVNNELGVLRTALPEALRALHIGGVAVVESYQSLEDTIVKKVFRAGTTSQAPPEMPVVPESLQPWLAEIVRGSELADADEAERNPRAKSVRLRAVQKIREARS
ncbi:16S rRNA (cytosine1402-N4)-methyltransferase [Brevibacterium sanguinis]|uniref:Ribosomal RNA small subunit methyltransferase H n=2 Tax=Brevibacterium TaxID=1696 RepID=A0A366IJN5_9MICO|nr:MULTISPECIES: 16S rRNA (cytosine(1402)-N(4))-methyltransferase RsmH [Brevibacterium]RBP64041.1 16S rRNA (cytosine1402-N4)-methyltransferase [Brevibacterium sanguinis]RBP70684.1 16S rRNA (cytosine1402-N4)-methyltransferase [Brevibacterium celere]